MKTRLNDEKDNRIHFDKLFVSDLNKVFKNHSNYDLRPRVQFKDLINKYDRYLPNNKFNPYLLNVSSMSYDFGFRSWLNVVFFTSTMKVNVVDNSKIVNSNSVDNSVDKINSNQLNNEFKLNNNHQLTSEQERQFILQAQITIQQQKQQNDHAWLKHLLAGGAAGVASRTFTAPIDRVKVLLQVKSPSEVKTLWSCFVFIFKEGGVGAYWRGNGINCIKIGPEIALKFMLYEQFKRRIKGDSDRQLVMYERFISGSLAGSIAQSIIYPLEVIKTRLCLRSTGQYNSILDATKKLYRAEGYRVFYRGFFVNLSGIFVYSGIDLTAYETLRNLCLTRFHSEDGPGFYTVLFCGVTSNICGQLISYPLALIRTRLQAIDDKSLGFWTLKRQIQSNHGFFGFYKGFFPSLMKVAPANFITYWCYEQIRQLLNVKMS